MRPRRLIGPFCGHLEGTKVFEVPREGASLCVHAGSFRGAFAGRYDLIIDLADMLDPPVRAYNLDGPLHAWAASRASATGLLKLRWSDGSIPPLDRDDWLELTRSLLAGRYQAVYVCCQGGHGRTGTFLAILGCLLEAFGYPGIPKDANPVSWLRCRYCDEAVESRMQLDYVALVSERDEVLATLPSGFGHVQEPYDLPTYYDSPGALDDPRDPNEKAWW